MIKGVAIFRRQFLRHACMLAGLLMIAGCGDKKSPAPATTAKPTTEAAPAEEAPPKEPPIELKAKWQVGKRYLIREETVQDATMSVPNQPEPVKTGNTVTRDFALTILSERPEGGHVMEVEFVANKIEARSGEKIVASFDSASDPKTDRTNALAKLNRKVAGAKFQYVTDASGNIERLDGGSNLVRKITLGLDRTSATLLKSQYSDDQLKRLGLLPEGLPGASVSPGDAWTNQLTMPISSVTAKFDIESKLSGYEERNSTKCAIIKNTGTAKIEMGNTPAAAVMQFENVKLEGEVVFSPEKGQFLASNMTISLDIKIKTAAQEVTQPVTIKSSRTLVEVTDVPKATEAAAAK